MTAAGNAEAARIAQLRLDETGAALLSGDFAHFARYFCLPSTIATAEGARVLRNPDELRRTFEEVAAFYRGLGVTTLDRRVAVALFDGPETIRYSHVTRLLRNNALLRPPQHSHSILHYGDGEWRVSDSAYAVSGANGPRDALLSGGEGIPPQGVPEILAVFQGNLDAITRSYFTRDFAVLRDSVQLPLFKQGTRGAEVFADEADLRADFDRYLAQMTMHDVTDMVRTVKTAHPLGEGRIYGTCLTHVLSGTRLLVPAYASAITLEQGADLVWRLTSIMHPTDRPTMDRLAAGAPA